jgi:hypothetical protein
VLFSLCAFVVLATGNGGAEEPGKVLKFQEVGGGPVIRMGDAVSNMMWNDPDVINDAGEFRMWLSGGDPTEGEHVAVRVYEARSLDGIEWTIDPTPVLSPSAEHHEWDSARIESPSVVKVGAVYHMYYAGADVAGAASGVYAIGHATSLDGRHWVKDPANPVLRAQLTEPTAWGFRGVGEPEVVVHPETGAFYVYYTSMRFSNAERSHGRIGIMLSTSIDGSTFTPVTTLDGDAAVILSRDIPDAVHGSWFGYSTPTVARRDNGEVHLICSFIVAPHGPTSARHVSLTYAVSTDGVNFAIAKEDFVRAGDGDWKDHQVRSPSLVAVGDSLAVWFAGESLVPHFTAGIGAARIQ